MLSSLEKQWLCATCAPESIYRIHELEDSILYMINNESKTKLVWVLASELRILGIGRYVEELQESKPCSIEDGVTKIGELLELSGVKIIKP